MGLTAARRRVRPPIVEGLFYPAEGGRLRESVGRLISRSAIPESDCMAVVSPHAGFTYAGEVMASAFRAMARRPVRTAVLIGPVHRERSHGIFLPESEVFDTPLGEMEVDTDTVGRLVGIGKPFTLSDQHHLEEHCLEVQLPFVSCLFPGAAIVPILVGDATLEGIEALARALRLTLDSTSGYTCLVATANMASYMTGTDADGEAAAIMRLIEDRDWQGIAAAAASGKTSSCGAGGVAALLRYCGDGARVERLAEADSRGVDGDPTRAVHYASFGIHKEEPFDHGVAVH